MCPLTSVLGTCRDSSRRAKAAIDVVVYLMTFVATATPAAGQKWSPRLSMRGQTVSYRNPSIWIG